MHCPYCGYHETKVIETRDVGDEAIRRRRVCLRCDKRFTTYERIERMDIFVIKKDGRRERFSRNKVMKGILKACEKRPISIEEIERLVENVESEIRKKDGVEVSSREIGEIVMRKLKELDHVAYIRFASVYKEFKDIDSFAREVLMLKNEVNKKEDVVKENVVVKGDTV